MAEKKDNAPACQHNVGVDCSLQQKRCDTCGWNPAVAKKRLVKYCADKHIPVPTKKEG